MAQNILFFSTGTVKIRPLMRAQKVGKPWYVRLGRALTDRSWTEQLPVGVFVIRHPDGPILFDAGQSVHCNSPGYTPVWAAAGHQLASFTIKESDGLLYQLREAGIQPSELQCIVLSHLHGDHTGGLAEVASEAPDVPIYVSAEQWRVFGNNQKYATLKGCNPQHWPKSFQPKLLHMKDGCAIGPWKDSSLITSDGSVMAVDTSGHVPGHLSLIYKPSKENRASNESSNSSRKVDSYFFTGDATYGIDVLEKELPDGINDNPAQALDSLRRIKRFALSERVVVLPSHDPDTAEILRTDRIYVPDNGGTTLPCKENSSKI